MQEAKHFAEQLLSALNEVQRFQYQILGAWLKLLLIYCNSACDLNSDLKLSVDNGSDLLRRYKQMLNANYSEWHNVSDYANALNVSADHLNRVVKSLSGKTAKEHIQSRIVLAAKRLIYFSSLSNKELSYQLGFSESANFSTFFKKCTGFTPSEFRKREKERKWA